jgi:hypothetical protein
MITEIENSREKIALIVETVDRLQRSFKETPIKVLLIMINMCCCFLKTN